jgi:hypothetical protein
METDADDAVEEDEDEDDEHEQDEDDDKEPRTIGREECEIHCLTM